MSSEPLVGRPFSDLLHRKVLVLPCEGGSVPHDQPHRSEHRASSKSTGDPTSHQQPLVRIEMEDAAAGPEIGLGQFEGDGLHDGVADGLGMTQALPLHNLRRFLCARKAGGLQHHWLDQVTASCHLSLYPGRQSVPYHPRNGMCSTSQMTCRLILCSTLFRNVAVCTPVSSIGAISFPPA